MLCVCVYICVDESFPCDQQNRNPEDYTLTFRDPAGCNVSDCVFFAGIDVNTGNTDYLDIYIEGDTASWVAVGFTDTPNMVGGVGHDITIEPLPPPLLNACIEHGSAFALSVVVFC